MKVTLDDIPKSYRRVVSGFLSNLKGKPDNKELIDQVWCFCTKKRIGGKTFEKVYQLAWNKINESSWPG